MVGVTQNYNSLILYEFRTTEKCSSVYGSMVSSKNNSTAIDSFPCFYDHYSMVSTGRLCKNGTNFDFKLLITTITILSVS